MYPTIQWKPDGGRYPYLVVSPIVFHSNVLGRKIFVPAGYRTDLASVPRIPFIYALVGNRAVAASIIHDWLHDCWGREQVTRKQADLVFLEAMERYQDPKSAILRRLMYWGVRSPFGAAAWRTDSSHKCKEPTDGL